MLHPTIRAGTDLMLRPTVEDDLATLRDFFANSGFNEQWRKLPLNAEFESGRAASTDMHDDSWVDAGAESLARLRDMAPTRAHFSHDLAIASVQAPGARTLGDTVGFVGPHCDLDAVAGAELVHQTCQVGLVSTRLAPGH